MIVHKVAALISFHLAAMLVFHGCAAGTRESMAPLFSVSLRGDNKISETMRNRILRYRFVEVNPEFLLASSHTRAEPQAVTAKLTVNLFDDTIVSALRESLVWRSETTFTWVGKAEGMADSQLTFVVEDGIVAGNIRLGADYYWLRSAGNGSHVIYQINSRAFPREGSPVVPPTR